MPWNFAHAKALCGDQSDNIPGVKGMGFKTAVKKIPMLATHEDIILQDVFNYCKAHRDESTVLQTVVDSIEQVKLNWRLVYLGSSSLNQDQSQRIDSALSAPTPPAEKLSIMKLLIKEGVDNFDVESYVFSFACVKGFSIK